MATSSSSGYMSKKLEPAALCETCQEAHGALLRDDGPHWKQAGRSPEHYLLDDCLPDLPNLLQSARTGCGFCAFLRGAILSDDAKDVFLYIFGRNLTEAASFLVQISLSCLTFLKLESDRRPGEDVPEVGLRSLAAVLRVGDFNAELVLDTFIEADPACPAVAEWLALRPPSKPSYKDEDSLDWLRRQLQWSIENSPLGLDEPPFVPERLVDVSGSSLRLVLRNDLMASDYRQPEYAALSYCWGPPEDARSQPKTLSSTLDENLKDIGFDTLSPVLKDAVEVTQALGIPYLWIDALCILQDDVSDWQRECSQMGHIYNKAQVTIIAASSRTCREGFLQPRRHGLRLPYQSARRPDMKGSFIIHLSHVYPEEGLTFSLLSDAFFKDLNHSRWSRRGWTFQENATSNRRILFGNEDVHVTCSTSVVSRNGPSTYDYPRPLEVLQQADPKSQYDAWGRLMLYYARFNQFSFTRPADVLPALSGLARIYGNVLQDHYLAGHWQRRLHTSLFWFQIFQPAVPVLCCGDAATIEATARCRQEQQQQQQQPPRLLPSWSCLTRGALTWPFWDDGGCESHINVLGFHGTKPAAGDDEDPYGAVHGDGCLALAGYVLRFSSLVWSESDSALVGTSSSAGDGRRGGGCCSLRFAERRPRNGLPVVTFATVAADDDDYDGRGHQSVDYYTLWLDATIPDASFPRPGNLAGFLGSAAGRLALLLLGSEVVVSPPPPPPPPPRSGGGGGCAGGEARSYYGLAMLPVADRGPGCFRRVGVFFRSGSSSSARQPAAGGGHGLPGIMDREEIKIF